jgi:hypothetical protein
MPFFSCFFPLWNGSDFFLCLLLVESSRRFMIDSISWFIRCKYGFVWFSKRDVIQFLQSEELERISKLFCVMKFGLFPPTFCIWPLFGTTRFFLHCTGVANQNWFLGHIWKNIDSEQFYDKNLDKLTEFLSGFYLPKFCAVCGSQAVDWPSLL